jgi:hypothetical protein
MDVVSRDEWGARAPRNRTLLTKAAVDELVLHYSSMDAERRTTHAGCPEVVRNIQRFHMDTKGWSDIAYNMLFCQHGVAFEGRGWFVMGASTLHHNRHTQATCFLGGDAENRDDVTVPGRAAAEELVREFLANFGAGKRVVGHRDLSPTRCPGEELYAWLKTEPWKNAKPDPKTKPWPLPVPRWFWSWAKWRRQRFLFASQKEWRAARPKSAPIRVPDWAWVRLAAMTPQ